MIPADFDFQLRPPGPALEGYVQRTWHAQGWSPHRRERILPSARAVILVVLGPPLEMTEPREGAGPEERSGVWISGPHERPIINEPTAETWVVGMVLEPAGLGAVVSGSAARFANRLVRLEDADTSLGPGVALVEALSGIAEVSARLDRAEEWLTGGLQPSPDHDRWRAAIDALMAPEPTPVAEAQRDLGVSRRHFGAEVRRRTGLLPSAIRRIARLRHLLADLDARKPIRWSAEAVGAGYFDQAHSIRDFKAFTGMTPTEYVIRRREAWGHDLEPGEASNFVPEIIR